MGAGYCSVHMLGNLTRDPQSRFTQGGLAIVSFGLAINSKRKVGEEWKEETTFVDCTFFGKRGEAFAKYHAKGAAAFIVGRLRTEQWNDKQTNEKRSKLSVVCDEFQFVGGKGEAKPAGDSYTDAYAEPGAAETQKTIHDAPADDTPF